MNIIESSFYEMLQAQAVRNPDAEAVIMGDRKLTYGEFLYRIDGVASALLDIGLKKGDKVGLWSVASPAWLYAYFGIIRAGGIALLLNANMALKDAKPLIEFADTRFLMFGKTHDYEGHNTDAVAISESLGIDKEHCLSILDEEFADITLAEAETSGCQSRVDAYIIYTSGTTAFPKAVINSQFSLINLSDHVFSELAPILGNRALIGVPFFHVYALMGAWIYLAHGGTIVIPSTIKADLIADLEQALAGV